MPEHFVRVRLGLDLVTAGEGDERFQLRAKAQLARKQSQQV